MNKLNLPTWKEKKELLYNRELEVDPARLLDIGSRLEQAGRLCDALDFYNRASHRDGMEKLLGKAVSEGNFFLYRKCLDALGRAVSKEEAARLAANAVSKGKHSYAIHAFKAAGDEEGARKAKEALKEALPRASIIFEESEK